MKSKHIWLCAAATHVGMRLRARSAAHGKMQEAKNDFFFLFIASYLAPEGLRCIEMTVCLYMCVCVSGQ